MKEKSFKKYIILWLSQSISGLGSSMTGFALVLWAYEQKGSALSVSMMSFCNYVPYVILSLFVGSFIDRHSKKSRYAHIRQLCRPIHPFGIIASAYGKPFLVAYLCCKRSSGYHKRLPTARLLSSNRQACAQGEAVQRQRHELLFKQPYLSFKPHVGGIFICGRRTVAYSAAGFGKLHIRILRAFLLYQNPRDFGGNAKNC